MRVSEADRLDLHHGLWSKSCGKSSSALLLRMLSYCFACSVTLSSPILEQNVIVADVPGGSDVNRFRVDNASRYLQQCDTTIVVGKIDRLQDNTGFRQQYMDAFRRRRSGSVILVATRSDVSLK
jgi:hypothetical protein